MRRFAGKLGVASFIVWGCGGAQANVTRCPPGRTMLDGVCTSEPVADYIACVRGQGAKLGEERSKKLSMEAGYAGVHAAAASEAREHLEKSYSTSDANTLEVIRACGVMHDSAKDACTAAGSVGVTCGFEFDARFLATCQSDAEYRRCVAASMGDCNAFSMCGLEQFSRATCEGKGRPSGTASCEVTTKCQHACGGDASCICACNEKLMPSAAHGLASSNQCFLVRCAGCVGAACDGCFAQNCGAKHQRVCAGK